MWNAPILMFRYTRAYDRGDGEYSTLTTGGQTLTLYKKFRWLSVGQLSLGPDAQDQAERENYSEYTTTLIPMQVGYANDRRAWFLNGKAFTFPKWDTIGD
jgi:hypothetical protein